MSLRLIRLKEVSGRAHSLSDKELGSVNRRAWGDQVLSCGAEGDCCSIDERMILSFGNDNMGKLWARSLSSSLEERTGATCFFEQDQGGGP